jgi:hypothetical protein
MPKVIARKLKRQYAIGRLTMRRIWRCSCGAVYRCRCLQLKNQQLITVKKRHAAETYIISCLKLMLPGPKSGSPCSFGNGFGHSMSAVLERALASRLGSGAIVAGIFCDAQ